MTFNDIFMKNFKMNSRKYFVLFLCNSLAIALFFMYTTIFLNDNIRSEITPSLSDMLVAICIAIIFFTVCFFDYAYSSLLKSRNSEFGLLLGLGMVTKDIKRIVFIENSVITIASSLFGLLVGTIFSKLFFLGVVNVLHADYITYHINLENYTMTLGIFLTIFISIITIKDRKIKKLNVIELINSEKMEERLNVFHPLLGALGLILILFAFGIVYVDNMGYFYVPEKSTYFTLFCFSGLYLVISQSGSFFFAVSKKFKGYYIRNMLSLTEMNYKLSRNKDMMYILTILVSITLFFIEYAYSKYVIAKVEDGNFLIFISSFMAVLFFTALVSVIYFKLFSEIDEERIRYHNLNCIGITKSEVKRYINIELAIILFLPTVLGISLVFPYMAIEYINSSYSKEVLISVLVIFLLYEILDFIFFLIIKKKYIEAIIK